MLLLLTCAGLIISFIVKKQDKPTNKVEYYTVTFDVGEIGVKSIEPQKVEIGSAPILYKPECAVKSSGADDYEFIGWYYDGEKITEETVYAFNKDVTLTAKWRSLWTGFY